MLYWEVSVVARLKVRLSKLCSAMANVTCSSIVHVLTLQCLHLADNDRDIVPRAAGAVSKMEDDLYLEELRAKVSIP